MKAARAVYGNTLRWFFNAPARVAAAALLAALVAAVLGGGMSLEFNGVPAPGPFASPRALAFGGNVVLVALAWLLGVGLIRREAASGSLHLVLLRPIRRGTYVVSKWAALATLNLAFLALCYAVVLRAGAAGDLGGLAVVFLGQCVQILALCAVVTLFSALPWAMGEVGLLLLAVAGLLLLRHEASAAGWTGAAGAVDAAFRVLVPRAAPGDPVAGDAAAWAAAAVNALVAAGALAGAVALLKARELGYAEVGA